VATEVEGLVLTTDAGQSIAEFERLSLAADKTTQKVAATATGLRGFSQVISGGMSFDRTVRDINDLARGAGTLTNVLQSSDVLLFHMANIQLRGQGILAYLASNPWTLAIVGITAITSLMSIFGAESEKAAQSAAKIGAELHSVQLGYSGLIGRGGFRDARSRALGAGRRLDDIQEEIELSINSGQYTTQNLEDFGAKLGTKNYRELLSGPGISSTIRNRYNRLFEGYNRPNVGPGYSPSEAAGAAARNVDLDPLAQQGIVSERRQLFDFQAQHAGVLELEKTVKLLQLSNDERKKGQEIQKIQGDTAMQLSIGEQRYLNALIDYQERLQYLGKVGQAAGSTIANGFEAAIFQANTLRDAIRNVALELSKIAFRATAGQFIENFVGGAVRGLAGGAPNPNSPAFQIPSPDSGTERARLTPSQRGDTISSSLAGRPR
jgi:hypothetical protein